MFTESLKLLVAGMGMTFLFLILMIILMSILRKIVEPFKELMEPPKPAPKAATKPAAGDADIVAAACAFVRNRNK